MASAGRWAGVISIIIRSRNEERWIRECLRRIQEQSIRDVEVILVDNGSSDQTVARARQAYPDLKLVSIDEYQPGKAINAGIRASKGDYVAILSAHCLPVEKTWLETLLTDCQQPNVAGVYGRQIPTSSSSPQDKRDLLVTFGLDKRVQKKDIFFHNANSLIRREIWEQYPFDESVGNIEDRVWAKQVIDAGYVLIYEPDAAVYHYHGIYQNNNAERVEGAVRVMELLEESTTDGQPLDPDLWQIAAVIPVRGNDELVALKPELLKRTIEAAKHCKYIDRVFLVTDEQVLADQAIAWGAEAPFLRPMSLSEPDVRADKVLQYALTQLENTGYFPDLIVPLEVTFPFRPAGLLDRLVELVAEHGLDTAIAASTEHRPYWQKNSDGVVLVEEYAQSRADRTPLHIGLLSLGCVTYAEFVRQGSRLGKRIGVYEIEDPIASIEIRTRRDLVLLDTLDAAGIAWRNVEKTA